MVKDLVPQEEEEVNFYASTTVARWLQLLLTCVICHLLLVLAGLLLAVVLPSS